MTEFELHPRLAADCITLGNLDLCRVLLMDDARFPWLILVPRRPGATAIYRLPEDDQRRLWQESARLSAFLMETFRGDRLNLSALGNLVPQLHLHHVVRYRDDPCWPGPVWGCGERRPYDPDGLEAVCARLMPLFA